MRIGLNVLRALCLRSSSDAGRELQRPELGVAHKEMLGASSGNDPCRWGGAMLAVDFAMSDACGSALAVMAAEDYWGQARA
jgi:hypothetical protein